MTSGSGVRANCGGKKRKRKSVILDEHLLAAEQGDGRKKSVAYP